MTDTHPDVLDPKQRDLIPLVTRFAPSFYLAGGTALALQLGHRRSVDFDLFSNQEFENQTVRNRIREQLVIEQTIVDEKEELTVVVSGVKCTFLHFPYPVPHTIASVGQMTAPKPLTIAALKAFALGRRAKWKDYVDLYFVFQQHTLSDIVKCACGIFAGEFDEKLFREQLAYHEDINYSEAIQFMPGKEVPKKTILSSLLSISMS
jgi:hypothetical protein